MTATIHQLRPNARTHDRLRRQRKLVRDRLILKIGIDRTNGSLFGEEVLAQAMALHTWDKAIGLAR